MTRGWQSTKGARQPRMHQRSWLNLPAGRRREAGRDKMAAQLFKIPGPAEVIDHAGVQGGSMELGRKAEHG